MAKAKMGRATRASGGGEREVSRSLGVDVAEGSVGERQGPSGVEVDLPGPGCDVGVQPAWQVMESRADLQLPWRRGGHVPIDDQRVAPHSVLVDLPSARM